MSESGFSPLDCKWSYWEKHVTTDDSCICLHDACKTGNPEQVFAFAYDDYDDDCDYDGNDVCPCSNFEVR